jgi:hypothetical protein
MQRRSAYSDLNRMFALGSFQSLARGQQSSDHRLLLILDGGFFMKVG